MFFTIITSDFGFVEIKREDGSIKRITFIPAESFASTEKGIQEGSCVRKNVNHAL